MAGLVKSGQSVTAMFTTSLASTGAASNADSLPTGTLYVNGTANGATVTVTNVTTGRYKAAVTLPSLSAGNVVDLHIAATVSGVAGGGVVWSAIGDTVRLSDPLKANPATGGISSASFASGATIPRVTLADTLTTYTGNTPQTGDSYARIPGVLQTKAEADTAHGLLATSASLTAAQAALAALIAALNDIAAADVWTALDDASANKIADHVLRRSWATAAGSADGDALAFRSLLGAVAKLVNRVGIVGDTLTVYEDDDTTALGEQTLTSDADAEPITGVNTV